MTIKYLFENKDGKAFKDCSGEEMKIIVDGKKAGLCTEMDLISGTWSISDEYEIHVCRKYRVLAPEQTQNHIDWSVFPPEFKYCYTQSNHTGSSWISIEIPDADTVLGWYAGRAIDVTNFPVFRRGTVAPKDSLLIRPEGI